MISVVGVVIAGTAAAVGALAPSRYNRRGGEVTAAAQECAVCLSDLAGCAGEPVAAVRILPGCGHGFHAECIGRWLPLRPECPLCRRAVPGRIAVLPPPQTTEVEVAPTWSRPARIACGFGDGRVVWTRSPPGRQ